MKKEQEMVKEFHQAFELYVSEYPNREVPKNVRRLRESLIHEECLELFLALDQNELIAIADALGDILYVVLGTAVSYGLDMERIFAEIHRSNMTKVGGSKRGDGKWLKPESYEPPRLGEIIYGKSNRSGR